MPDNASPRISEEAQEQKRKEQKTYRARFLRILVFYPLAWIIVSLILFYLVKIN